MANWLEPSLPVSLRATRGGPWGRSKTTRLVLGLALARVGLGMVALGAPQAVARPWIGADASSSGARLLGRALAGRDIALGLGLLIAILRGDRLCGWVEAGVVADAVDSALTAGAFRRLPRLGRWLVLASTTFATGAGTLGLRQLWHLERVEST